MARRSLGGMVNGFRSASINLSEEGCPGVGAHVPWQCCSRLTSVPTHRTNAANKEGTKCSRSFSHRFLLQDTEPRTDDLRLEQAFECSGRARAQAATVAVSVKTQSRTPQPRTSPRRTHAFGASSARREMPPKRSGTAAAAAADDLERKRQERIMLNKRKLEELEIEHVAKDLKHGADVTDVKSKKASKARG